MTRSIPIPIKASITSAALEKLGGDGWAEAHGTHVAGVLGSTAGGTPGSDNPPFWLAHLARRSAADQGSAQPHTLPNWERPGGLDGESGVGERDDRCGLHQWAAS